jgi:hypothetical protein
MSLKACEQESVISQLLRASIGLQKALDRCFSGIRPTVRGQRAVPELKRVFEKIHGEILAGVQSEDLLRLGSILTALHENAGRLYKGKAVSHLQRV